ncbi:DUF6197 family protein [Streptomyces globosus]|uniref:DUF6197 family protein n=1 Tax=Streptomyces globosus TaxID=68209 RepID=UPI0031DEE13B
MPQLTAPPARPTVPARPALDLDARMAAVDAEMTVRLELAGLTLDVDTVHASPPLDLADVITGPVPLPEPEEAPHTTPAAATLQRAARRLRTGGWCRGATVTADGARCLVGAVRAEAPTGRAEDDALTVLLDVLRRHYPDIASVPDANDRRLPDLRAVLRVLGEAAVLADTQSL